MRGLYLTEYGIEEYEPFHFQVTGMLEYYEEDIKYITHEGERYQRYVRKSMSKDLTEFDESQYGILEFEVPLFNLKYYFKYIHTLSRDTIHKTTRLKLSENDYVAWIQAVDNLGLFDKRIESICAGRRDGYRECDADLLNGHSLIQIELFTYGFNNHVVMYVRFEDFWENRKNLPEHKQEKWIRFFKREYQINFDEDMNVNIAMKILKAKIEYQEEQEYINKRKKQLYETD